MHARVNTIQVQPERIDELAAAAAQPLLSGAKQRAHGLKTVMLCDRGSGKLVMVSRWESAAAAGAAEPVYREAMGELAGFLTQPAIREQCGILLEA